MSPGTLALPTADSKQDGGASAPQATLGGPGSALRERPPLLPAAGTQPRPEEPAPWRAGAPPTQARKPRPHLGGAPQLGLEAGGLPKRTKGPGNSRAAQAPEDGSPGGHPGVGKLPWRRRWAGCQGEAAGWAGTCRLRTAQNKAKAPKPPGALQPVGTWSSQDSGRKEAPSPHGLRGGRGRPKPGGEVLACAFH